ncbi:MAG TPA: Hsp20/alpha crystallin family protein [Panacibacter sp.]|nr:Hsp20/alpha crystallin family protein [Panacibacter sp.]HNP45538.1 Hsp20/alpha crystallin family protein [Panacibacter sp.]
MHYNQSCAAKGDYGSRYRQQLYRSMQRAAVNIFKTENSYEMLVFAPGRIKEHFHIDVKGMELTVSYTPPEGFARPDWIHREYSRGAFQRTFTLDDTVEAAKISAKYEAGVLHIVLPVIPGKETLQREIVVS